MRPPRRWLVGVGLLAILILATALRLYHLNDKSFWYDEFASVELACGRGYAHFDIPANQIIADPPRLMDLDYAAPLLRVWNAEQRGQVPPLYFFLLRVWGEAFGLGQGSARAFSLVMSVAGVAAMFWAVRELTDDTTPALWAALLMALAGPQIQFAQEARAYSLLVLEGLLAAAALARIERRGLGLFAESVLTLALLAMTLTHYFALGTIVALAIYAGVRLRGAARSRVVACFFIALAGWCVLGAPLVWRHLHSIEPGHSVAFLDDAGARHVRRTFFRLALLPVRYFTEPMGNSIIPAAVGAVAYVLAIVLPRRRNDLLLWGLWLWLTILPIAALDLVRQTQHLEFIRYTLLASPAMYGIVAAALPRESKKLRHLPPMLVALACVLAIQAAYQAWWKADWRALANVLDREARPGDVIVFAPYPKWDTYPHAAYLHTSYYRRTPANPIVLLRDAPDAELSRQLRQAPGILIVTLTGDWPASLVRDAKIKGVGFEPGAGAVVRMTWPEPTTSPR